MSSKILKIQLTSLILSEMKLTELLTIEKGKRIQSIELPGI